MIELHAGTTEEPLRIEPHPTDVWVCIRSGVYNLTNPDPSDNRIPNRTTRAILRGLLLAAVETLDEIDRDADMGVARVSRGQR